jgi:hypothetical protein
VLTVGRSCCPFHQSRQLADPRRLWHVRLLVSGVISLKIADLFLLSPRLTFLLLHCVGQLLAQPSVAKQAQNSGNNSTDKKDGEHNLGQPY